MSLPHQSRPNFHSTSVADKKGLIFSILDTPAFGGAEQYLLQQLIFLNQQGYPVAVTTNHQQVAEIYQRAGKEHGLENWQILPGPYRLDAIGNWKGLLKFVVSLPWAMSWFYWQLRQLRRQSPTGQVICYFPGFSDRLVFSPIVKWLRQPLIWIEIGPLEPTFTKNWGFPKWLYRRVQHLPDLLVTTSDFTRRSMIKTGQLAAAKITLVYPSITPWSSPQLKKFKTQGQIWRRKHHLQKTLLIGWVGRLARENQLELLLEALARRVSTTSKLKQPLNLVIVGDGPERGFYQEMVTALGLEKFATFTGFVSETEKASIISSCDFFVFTRSWTLDGFGMTTIEAMSLGVPIINPAFGAQVEIIEEGKSGLHFVSNDVADLQKQILKLANSKTLRLKLGEQGRRRVMAIFQHQLQNKKLLSVIKKIDI
jgi:glycosyltransferase involved in cell wall biosynthesis